MHKFIVTLMASLLSCSAAFAFWPEATDSSLEIGVGYRQDRLEWKTHSNFDSSSSGSYGYDDYGFFPARLRSHLKWRNLEIWQIEARGTYVTCDNIYLRANGDYGWITHGKNTDKDFVGFNRRFEDSYFSGSEIEFGHSKSRARGNVYDAKIAVGYQFKLCDDSFAIAPLIGYSWHGQHIEDRHLRNENLYVDEYSFVDFEDGIPGERARSHHHDHSSDYSSASLSSFDSSSSFSSSSSSHRHGRHSKYHTRWDGFFLGFDFDYRFGCGCEADWELFGAYEFHWAEYHAKGHWHLRRDLFDGFQHRAKNAYGHVFDIGIKWDFCECWTLALKGEFQWWWADHGHDRAKNFRVSRGNVHNDCFTTIPLRDIKWESASVILDLGMVF